MHLISVITRLLVNSLKKVEAYKKETIKAPYYWPFVRGNLFIDPPRKQMACNAEMFPYHDIITDQTFVVTMPSSNLNHQVR